MNKTIVTVTGIRPDFIRMCEVFKKLDENFNHILVHTGQHYDELLSDIFFKELKIREPDFNLNVGSYCREHFHQTGVLSERLIELLREKNYKARFNFIPRRFKFRRLLSVSQKGGIQNWTHRSWNEIGR